MKFFTTCGGAISDEAKFCTNCGAGIKRTDAKAPVATPSNLNLGHAIVKTNVTAASGKILGRYLLIGGIVQFMACCYFSGSLMLGKGEAMQEERKAVSVWTARKKSAESNLDEVEVLSRGISSKYCELFGYDEARSEAEAELKEATAELEKAKHIYWSETACLLMGWAFGGIFAVGVIWSEKNRRTTTKVAKKSSRTENGGRL